VSLVEWLRTLAKRREQGCQIGQTVYVHAVEDMAWWVESVPDAEARQRLLARFTLLQREPAGSPAYENWVRDYQNAIVPPKS
jgi:hypothetical protein